MSGQQAKGYVRQEQTALSTTPPLPQQLHRGLQGPLACARCCCLVSPLGSKERERRRGLTEEDLSDPNQPGKAVSDSPLQPPSCTAGRSSRPKAKRGATVRKMLKSTIGGAWSCSAHPAPSTLGMSLRQQLQACCPLSLPQGMPLATAYLPVGS